MNEQTWLVEGSLTPIYDRIARAVAEALVQRRQEVVFIDPRSTRLEEWWGLLRRHADATYLSTNPNNLLRGTALDGQTRLQELHPGRLIFVHHDDILKCESPKAGIDALRSWQRVDARSAHLCLEPSNASDLRAIGLSRVSTVLHASEFVPRDPRTAGFRWTTSFMGHVMPSSTRPGPGASGGHAFAEILAAMRQQDPSTNLDQLIDQQAHALVGETAASGDAAVYRIATKRWLRSLVHEHSLAARGWFIEQARLPSVTIFGGDPAYLHGMQRKLTLGLGNVEHRDAVFDTQAVQDVFRDSCINLNFTSLQFDTAVVNRVFDVFMAGGLCLTDYRDGLATLTNSHAEFSWKTLSELRERVAYWSDPARARERALLIRKVQADLGEHGGYTRLADRLIAIGRTL